MIITENCESSQNDRFWLEKYGMTKEEFDRKYPRLDDMEFMKLYIGSKKYVDNSFREL